MKRYRLWLDRALTVVTAVVAVAALYILTTERLLPALSGEPVRVGEGEALPRRFEFLALSEGNGGSNARAKHVVPGGRPTLLLVFNSTCPACYANLPAWQRVVDAAGGAASVLAVALERDSSAGRAYARRHLPAAVAVVPADPRAFAGTFGVDVVPFTALVGSGGVVEFVRRGRLDSIAVSSVIHALGVLDGPSGP